MDAIRLSVSERQETGDGPARRLRAQGRIPGVTYGKGKVATAISVSLEDLKAALAHGQHVVLELDFGKGAKGSKAKTAGRYAVVQQLQFHPTKRNLLHIDLHEIELGDEIEAQVGVELVGTAPGLSDGGVIDWERREVTVRALPGDMPESLTVDVSELLIGHHLTVGAIVAPTGVTVVDDPEAVLVALVPPRVEQAAPVAEEAAEPEVVGSQASEE